MTILTIKIQDDCGEGPVSIPFAIPTKNLADWKATVLAYAKAALWDACYTPGSVAWTVFHGDVDLKIGEGTY